LEILQLEGQDLARSQAIEQHQPYQGEVAKGTEATPKFRDFFSRERHDHTLWLPQAKAYGQRAPRPTIAEWAPPRVDALKVRLAGGDLTAIVKAI
jgi:hypothetical protein